MCILLGYNTSDNISSYIYYIRFNGPYIECRQSIYWNLAIKYAYIAIECISMGFEWIN